MTQQIQMNVLDHGYVKLIDSWGSDQAIIEAARMSTNKGFLGWGKREQCEYCGKNADEISNTPEWMECAASGAAHHFGPYGPPGDEKLLAFLYKNHHDTPFEMAGMTIEVMAPIFVFREWHRHRTQSYNEMSARYTPLPDVNYIPSQGRLGLGLGALLSGNKQAAGTSPLQPEHINDWLRAVESVYQEVEKIYQFGLSVGVPKEVARIVLPVGRYSRMRASANLRNWLHFLDLRTAENAQWEIRQYANATGILIAECFPRVYQLFCERPRT